MKNKHFLCFRKVSEVSTAGREILNEIRTAVRENPCEANTANKL